MERKVFLGHLQQFRGHIHSYHLAVDSDQLGEQIDVVTTANT